MAKKGPSLKDYQIQAGKEAIQYYPGLLQWAAQNAGMPGGMLPQGQGSMARTQPMAGSATRFQGAAGGGFGMRPGNLLAQYAAQGQLGGGQDRYAAQGVLPNSALGIFGQNPADQLRLNEAEDAINKMASQRARMLQYRLGQQGIGNSGVAASALAQNENDALSRLADFRRQLAIGSGQEQERRMALLAQYLGLGNAVGQQGQNVYAQQQMAQAQKPGLFGQIAPLASMFSFKPIGL